MFIHFFCFNSVRQICWLTLLTALLVSVLLSTSTVEAKPSPFLFNLFGGGTARRTNDRVWVRREPESRETIFETIGDFLFD